MKRTLIICGLALLGLQTVSAQEEDTWVPQHVGVSLGVGTTGLTIDASTNINRWFGVRLGVDIMPKIKIGTTLDLGIEDKTNGTSIDQMSKYIDDLNNKIDIYNATPGVTQRLDRVDKSMLPKSNLPNSFDVEGQLSNTTFHFLIDFYPIKGISLHATVGAYFGPSKVIKVYNKGQADLPQGLTPINQWNKAIIAAKANPTSLLYTQVVRPNKLDMIGAELGDYFITPNPADNGNVEANIKVNGFRPYFGIGYGRAVPKKRIGCQFDLGVQLWNTPKVYAPTYDKTTGLFTSDTQLLESNAGGDAGAVIKTISKVSIYPVLNIRLVGRIL